MQEQHEKYGGAQPESFGHLTALGNKTIDGQGSGGQSSLAPSVIGSSPLAELDQLVNAERLREIVWDVNSRPSLQWLRKETKRRMLPFIRRGRLIFYRPRSVMDWYLQRENRPANMK